MIENKKENQLGIKSATNVLAEELSQEAKNLPTKLSNQEKVIYYKKLNFKGDRNLNFDFREYKSLKELFKGVYYRNISIGKGERMQDEYEAQLAVLERYKPKHSDYLKEKKDLLINVKSFYGGTEESADKRKKKKTRSKRIKILTPEQMLSRLPISLAQLKAGNNSQKLKNEIRQLLYSLYRSKKQSKTIYKHLMNTVI